MSHPGGRRDDGSRPLRRFSELRRRRLRFDEAVLERIAMSRGGLLFLLKVAPRVDRILIPRSKGRLSSTGLDKVGLVTTTGARSGLPRTHPLVLIDDGDGLLAIGSNYGRASHPAWTHNLDADPDCTVEFCGPPRPYRAELLSGPARERAWTTATDFYAGYERYAASAAPRVIKLYRLRAVTS